MSQVVIAYWSGTGNTQKMAQLLSQGVEAAGGTAKVEEMEQISAEELKECAAFALGCPSMGDEVLEEDTAEPFVAEVEGFASGKKIALFGSYGWGDGQWMRDWEERMKTAGAKVLGGEGIICQEEPDDDTKEKLIALGKNLAG